MLRPRCLLVPLAVALLGGAGAASASAAMTARGSVGEAYVLGATPGKALRLVDRRGRSVARGRADRFGSKVFSSVAPGAGYRVRPVAGGAPTRAFAVLGGRSSTPPAAFYAGKALKEGLNYVTMRDGIELAMTVRLPPGKTLADGPFPTVIEHSGYQTAAPKNLLDSLVTSVTGGGAAKADPLAPATSTVVGAVIAPLFGFASVSVQMRGSGCSGGAFDLFGLPTTYDGYDMVETVAAQSWAKGGKVGLVGISFSGITQLFTAGTRPPHLAAITPMSVTDDLYSGATFPGGIRNSGFATSWAGDRMEDAAPAPAGGQPWAKALTKAGDQNCIANQRLRLQTRDAVKRIRDNAYRTPSLYADRAASRWMRRIDVPTFLVGQFQDEQTGPHFAESLKALAGNPKVWITMQNGVHSDSLGPSSITRWAEFLKLYVADEIPSIPPTILGLSGQLYRFLADAGAAPVEQSRFAGTTDVAAARAVFEDDPRVRLLMDNGAGAAGPGSIGATWELGYGSWPVRQAAPTSFYLGAGGRLDRAKPTTAATAAYVADSRARPAQTLPGDGETDAWKAQPPYRWTPLAKGKGLGFTSAPLATDLVVAGSSSLDVWLRSTAADTDLQVTLTEVRPDGNETYVQNGWLRASHRKLDAAASTAVTPVPTHLRQDAAPLPKGKWALVRVPIAATAHAFRAGSRLRVSVTAPGGDRPRWRFSSVDRGTARNTVSLGGARASRLVLPVVAGATAKGTPLPAPTALRGEPNRTYVPASNGG